MDGAPIRSQTKKPRKPLWTRKLHAPENQQHLVQRPPGQIDRTVPERTSLQKCSPGPRNHAKKAEEVTETLGDYKCINKRQRNTPAADKRSRDSYKGPCASGVLPIYYFTMFYKKSGVLRNKGPKTI